MLPEARIVHSLPGRFRLKFDRQTAADALLAMAEQMQGCPGIRSITANPLTGSLLILHDTQEEAILRYAEAQAVFKARPAGETQDRPDPAAGLRALSQGVHQVTGGSIDLDGLLVLVLTGLAVQQAIEGNVMVPAAALLWNAYTLSRLPPLHAELPAQGARAADRAEPTSDAPHKGRAKTASPARTRQNARKHRAATAR